MLVQNVIDTFWFERPLWVAVDSFIAEEEAPEVEEFIYHRPVLESEVLELLEPKPGSLIVDATCGGGGHTEALLESLPGNSKMRSADSASCETVRSICAWIREPN